MFQCASKKNSTTSHTDDHFCSEQRGKTWRGVNKAVGREGSLCGFKGRNDRQKHGQRKRQVEAEIQSQIID